MYSKPSACPYAPAHLCFFRVSAHMIAQVIKAALLENKPASDLSDKSLLTIVNSQDSLQGPTGRFYVCRVVADDPTVQCENKNRELRLSIALDLLVQCELELNNIYQIVHCMPSFKKTTAR